MSKINQLFSRSKPTAKSNLAVVELPETPSFPQFEDSNPTPPPTVESPKIVIPTAPSDLFSFDSQPFFPTVQSSQKPPAKPRQIRKKLGRPALPLTERKIFRITATMTENEFNEISLNLPSDITLSDYVKGIVLNHIRTFNQFRK